MFLERRQSLTSLVGAGPLLRGEVFTEKTTRTMNDETFQQRKKVRAKLNQLRNARPKRDKETKKEKERERDDSRMIVVEIRLERDTAFSYGRDLIARAISSRSDRLLCL